MSASKLKSSGNGGAKPKKEGEVAQKPKRKAKLTNIMSCDRMRSEIAKTQMLDGVNTGDEKSIAPPPTTSALNPTNLKVAAGLLKDVLRGNLLKGNREFRVKLAWGLTNATSGAAAAQAFSNAVRPSLSAEFTSFADLFDEYKALGAECMLALQTAQTNTAAVQCILVYDPLSSTALTGIAQGMVADKHIGPFNTHSDTTNQQNPDTMITKTGFWHHTVKMYSGPQDSTPGGGSVATGGVWVDTADATVDWGYFKGYVSAPSVSTSVAYGFMRATVAFRARS